MIDVKMKAFMVLKFLFWFFWTVHDKDRPRLDSASVFSVSTILLKKIVKHNHTSAENEGEMIM